MTAMFRRLDHSATQRWAEAKRCAFAIHVSPTPTTDLRHNTPRVCRLDTQAIRRLRLDHTFRLVSQHIRVLIVRLRTCKILRELLAMDKPSAFATLLVTIEESAITVAQRLESAGCHPCLLATRNRLRSDHLNLARQPLATPSQTTVSSHSTLAPALSP
jgi:hypothetical protein